MRVMHPSVPNDCGILNKINEHGYSGPTASCERTPSLLSSEGCMSIREGQVQARYRWEIAPLSDIFIVYTRISNITTALGNSDFGDLLSDAWNRPIGNQLVMKIRYRFGS